MAQAAMEMSWGWDRGNQGTRGWGLGRRTVEEEEENVRVALGVWPGVRGPGRGCSCRARLGLEKHLVKSRSINRCVNLKALSQSTSLRFLFLLP